jgi:hypothetical protein
MISSQRIGSSLRPSRFVLLAPDAEIFNTEAYARAPPLTDAQLQSMIRKLKSGGFRLYSRNKNPRTGKRRNLGTFKTLAAAKRHERAVQFFKRH